ncbi:hypothetical protein [Anaerosporobacter faecicola]|uniref:hypothetical protein n=1 Tax=Anaerosporobacter faecicola TaxID=2718714 RepID=UPI00143C8884|nr:hypothetical protein [Anaerosporobacter faecicola]
MKNKKIIQILTTLILILLGIATFVGLFSRNATAFPAIRSVYGETIELYNKGIYARDSLSMGSQAVAQDFVTLVLGVPLLCISLYLIKKKKDKGLFLLVGTTAYILYTYMSYSFLIVYNDLYLIYLLLMILSFYTFLLSINEINQLKLCEKYASKFHEQSLRNILWIVGGILGLMWLGRILPTIGTNKAPVGLEHYSTLGIQTLDLGFIVPSCIVAGILLNKKSKWGYLLGIILITKAVTMVSAVSAMTVFMRINGAYITLLETFLFPLLLIPIVYYMIKVYSWIKE